MSTELTLITNLSRVTIGDVYIFASAVLVECDPPGMPQRVRMFAGSSATERVCALTCATFTPAGELTTSSGQRVVFDRSDYARPLDVRSMATQAEALELMPRLAVQYIPVVHEVSS